MKYLLYDGYDLVSQGYCWSGKISHNELNVLQGSKGIIPCYMLPSSILPALFAIVAVVAATFCHSVYLISGDPAAV